MGSSPLSPIGVETSWSRCSNHLGESHKFLVSAGRDLHYWSPTFTRRPVGCSRAHPLRDQGKHRHLSSTQRICRGLCQQHPISAKRAANGSIHSHKRATDDCSLLIRENTGTLALPSELAEACASGAVLEKLLMEAPIPMRGPWRLTPC